MPGHFSQILGDSAEEDFYALARAIGYDVIRRRNLSPGIDFVARFSGTTVGNCELLRPQFSPDGMTAFSIKSGDAASGDVDELVQYISQCRSSKEDTLRQITGGVLVVGTSKTAEQINNLLAKHVFCWDTKRLIFYSMKAKTADRLASTGRVVEYQLRNGISGGFMQAPESMISNSALRVEVHVFVDDHNLVIQGDHVTEMLDQIYDEGLLPIIQSMHYAIELRMSLHAMGPIQRQVADLSYRDFSSRNRQGLILPADESLQMQSYATAPWTAIFRA